MSIVVRFTKILICSAILSACASAGRDFVRPAPGAFQLGTSTYVDVVSKVGEPLKTGELVSNGAKMNSITYVYSNHNDPAAEEDVKPVGIATYFFLKNVLVGESFASSFKADCTNFDEGVVHSIKKGKAGDLAMAQRVASFRLQFASYPPGFPRRSIWRCSDSVCRQFRMFRFA